MAGEQGILGIEFSQYALANFIGQAALACILLDGGLRTSFKSFRVGLRPAITLATWGVLVTVMVFGTWLPDVDWCFSFAVAAAECWFREGRALWYLLSWLLQAVLFVVLGLLVTPSNVINVWHYSVLIILAMLLVMAGIDNAFMLFDMAFGVVEPK